MLTILHATDLHLRRHLPGSSGLAVRRSREIPALLERLADVVRDRRPDLVVLTGDLVDVPYPFLRGAPADYPELMAESVADYALLRDWLDRLPCPWQVVPGNHDHVDAFAEVFARERVEDRRIGGFRVLGFDDWEGEGHVARRVGGPLDRFRAVLADGDPAPQIHLQHYLIRPDVAFRYPLMYGDAAELAAAVEASGRVRAVLSGHWHKGEPPLAIGGTTYSVCPTFSEWPHRFRLVACHPDRTEIETLALDGADARRRSGAFLGLDLLLGRALPAGPIRLAPEAAPLLRAVAADGRLPVVVAPWEPAQQGWRAMQIAADAVARSARDAGAELDAAYFVVPFGLDAPTRERMPAEGAPTAGEIFPQAARELGLDLARSVFAGDDDVLAAVAAAHGVRSFPLARS